MEGNEELCARIEVLKRRVLELSDMVMFLEAEVLALGNLLISSKSISSKDLNLMTELVLKQKIKDRENEKSSSPIHMTKEELQSAIQGKINR